MQRKIFLIEAHPDAGAGHYGDALADAYAAGAEQGGHSIDRLRLNSIEFPLLKSASEWRDGEPPADIARAQQAVRAAVVLFYPLWLGDMPALLKAFLEQLLRPAFAFTEPKGKLPEQLLKGRSARIVVTMGMPALAYRLFYRAHSVRSMKRNILHFSGIRPVRTSLVGTVEGKPKHRQAWLERMHGLGHSGR
jgi:putative NADPH-quinone reductase